MYDVTEIDTVNKTARGVKGNQSAILYIIHELDPTTAADLISSGPISRVIMNKWYGYRWLFYLWFFLHLVYTGVLTWYAVERSQKYENETCPRDISAHVLTNTYHFVSLGLAVIYIAIEISRNIKSLLATRIVGETVNLAYVLSGIVNWIHQFLFNPYGNGWFRLCFLVMSACLIADVFLVYRVECYDNYMLLCAVVIGWFLLLFFLRSWERYSFFTLLIQKIILNEMVSFFVIFAIEILAFGTALYMVIQGTELVKDPGYSSYWHLMVSMFRLTVGNGELGNLYSTKYPGLAIAIFIAFVIMTILLMLNALIAVLGQSATELMDSSSRQAAHHKHFLFQRLSIILFIESFIPTRLYKVAGDRPSSDFAQAQKRQTIKMKSLRSPGSPENDEEANIEDIKNAEKIEDEEPETKVDLSLNGYVQNNRSRRLDIYSIKEITTPTLHGSYVASVD